MEIYDYIVVGAGSSGCVVASRLSEDPAVRVLLVEAGPDMNTFWVRTPAGGGKLFMDRRFNWAFDTEPVPTLGGRTVYWPRGKGLGGSSSINGMIYMRGQPGDFDHWAALGNPGWSWNEVLPYFVRSETNQHAMPAARPSLTRPACLPADRAVARSTRARSGSTRDRVPSRSERAGRPTVPPGPARPHG